MQNFKREAVFVAATLTIFASNMTNAADMNFTTRDYIQGDRAVTDLAVHNGQYILVMRGDVMDSRMPGAGVFTGTISLSDEEALARAHAENKKYDGFTPSPLIDKFVVDFFNQGEKQAKLDALVDITPRENKLLATLSFRNTGRKQICFKSPASWEGTFNPIAGNSWARIDGIVKGTDGREKSQRIAIDSFGGKEMTNAKDFPDGIVCIPPGHSKNANFLVIPNEPIKKGTYKIAGAFVIKEISEPHELRNGVEFFSLMREVNFPGDYPSTPGEFRAFREHLDAKQKTFE